MQFQRWNNVETTLCKVEKRLHWRCANLSQRCFNVEHRSCINIVQCWKSDFRSRILFHFQRRINVTSTAIHNVETILISLWNVDWVVSMKKLILRNILPVTLLINWNLQVFFKDYSKTFTTPVLTNFFWWLLLRIRLRLAVSNSSSLQQVSF